MLQIPKTRCILHSNRKADNVTMVWERYGLRTEYRLCKKCHMKFLREYEFHKTCTPILLKVEKQIEKFLAHKRIVKPHTKSIHECSGHWRTIKGLGKDQDGVRNIQGKTWVKCHMKGREF